MCAFWHSSISPPIYFTIFIVGQNSCNFRISSILAPKHGGIFAWLKIACPACKSFFNIEMRVDEIERLLPGNSIQFNFVLIFNRRRWMTCVIHSVKIPGNGKLFKKKLYLCLQGIFGIWFKEKIVLIVLGFYFIILMLRDGFSIFFSLIFLMFLFIHIL